MSNLDTRLADIPIDKRVRNVLFRHTLKTFTPVIQTIAMLADGWVRDSWLRDDPELADGFRKVRNLLLLARDASCVIDSMLGANLPVDDNDLNYRETGPVDFLPNEWDGGEQNTNFRKQMLADLEAGTIPAHVIGPMFCAYMEGMSSPVDVEVDNG